MEKTNKKGMGETASSTKAKSMRSGGTSTGGKVIATTRKLMEAPQRLLEEEDINELMDTITC